MRFIYLTLLGLVVLSSSAYSAESKPAKYFVEPMTCKGEIEKQPRGMADGYRFVVIEFTSFKATRKDGTLADSLEVKVGYSKDPGDDSDLGGEVSYGSPLLKAGKKVILISNGGRDEALDLNIVKSAPGVDILKGTFEFKGTTVGDYVYNLDCTAKVVKSPSRIDDYTAPK